MYVFQHPCWKILDHKEFVENPPKVLSEQFFDESSPINDLTDKMKFKCLLILQVF